MGRPSVLAPLDPAELPRLQERLGDAARRFGLDPFPVVFEMVDFDAMNEIVSYAGFPSRYPHWRFGMEYETLRKSHAYGLHKIYELVINNHPAIAYLLRSNSAIEQKIVIAHVFGHSDFFKNNLWFAPTHRRMLDKMAGHGARIRRYMDRFGVDAVEEFLDGVLSLEHLIDPHSMYLPQARAAPSFDPYEDAPGSGGVRRLPSPREYLDRYINPPEFLERERKKLEEERARKKRIPERPERDVLLFLMERAPLETWQQDVVGMIREESYYFAPQWMTKVMNEGWASFWHARILTEKALTDEEVVDFADVHSGVLGGGAAMNPYKLGVELYRDIQERWDKGRFGREYEECDDAARRRAWDTKAGQGLAKIFEVRRVHNDVTFLDNFLTKEFCERQKLFLYKFNPQRGTWEIASRDFATIKRNLLARLANGGRPTIQVEDGNYRNRGELLLAHRHEGLDLDLEEARDTLRVIQKIWRRPVHLRTIVEGQSRLLSFDGQDHKETVITEKA